ncbi:unnamed protein product [Pylaiella littoralis]
MRKHVSPVSAAAAAATTAGIAVAVVLGAAPLCCLATVAASVFHQAQPHATNPPPGDPALLDQQLSHAELRRTIEDSVLKGLATNMLCHREKVERGKLRPRPFVTLTYAQSIDGSIAGADKSQVCLSGPESRTMTHGLRSIHDAILVGAGTVRQDNPRLNVRHWPPVEPSVAPTEGDSSSSDSYGSDEGGAHGRPNNGPDTARGSGGGDESGSGSGSGSESGAVAAAPRAVILAGSLSELPRSMRLGSAVVFTDLSSPEAWRWLAEWAERSREGPQVPTANDFVIVHCRVQADGRCDVGDCLEKLYSMGFRSLMVEGGANVISTFLRGCCREGLAAGGGGSGVDGKLVDRVVVTIAPTFLQGYNVLATEAKTACDGAPTAAPGSGFPLPLRDVGYVQLGQDLVVVGAPAPCGDYL